MRSPSPRHFHPHAHLHHEKDPFLVDPEEHLGYRDPRHPAAAAARRPHPEAVGPATAVELTPSWEDPRTGGADGTTAAGAAAARQLTDDQLNFRTMSASMDRLDLEINPPTDRCVRGMISLKKRGPGGGASDVFFKKYSN